MRRSSLLAAAAAGAVVLALAVSPGSGAAAAGPAGSAGGARPDAAAAKIPSLVRQQAARLRAELARTGTAKLSAAARRSLGAGLLGVDVSGALDLQLHTGGPVTGAQLAQLRALGVTVRSSSADFAPVAGANLPPAGLVHAGVPTDKLDSVAALPWVAAVRPVTRPAVDVGPVTSEGVHLHRADVAQQIGITGGGQRVGAMSDGVTSLADSVAHGELPPDVKVIDPGDGDEGTAMLEIVHDMAPGAGLLFSGTGDTLDDHVRGLRALANAGATHITEDLAFDDEPAFQQGLAASTAEALAASGVWVSSSAGNLGARHTPRVAAVGTGSTPDGLPVNAIKNCPTVPQNAVAVAGGSDTTFDLLLGAGGLLLATLQWSEPRAIYPTPGQGGFTDLNLYVLDTKGRCLAFSDAPQANGVGDTIEQVLLDGTHFPKDTQLKFVVDVKSTSSAVAPPTLDLRWRTAFAGSRALDAPSRAGSLNPDSNYLGAATSAGAVNASASTDPDPKTVPLEGFSAGGPVQVGSTTQCPGGTTGPCTGVAGGGFRTAIAPTWTAANRVSIRGSGGFPDPRFCPTTVNGRCLFAGTSAAAPSAAGVAALVREHLGGGLSPVQLNAAMANLALDRGAKGPDNSWGAGVLRVLPV